MKKLYIFLTSILFAFSALANNKLPQTGIASYYGDRANHRLTACYDRYCKDSFTAAHRTLPFGTYLKVVNLKNNKSVIVRINDRGPRGRHRIIDLSGAAATVLGMRGAGLAKVTINRATNEEIIDFQTRIVDSINAAKALLIDSCNVITVNPTMPPAFALSNSNAESFKIQGGAFHTKKSANKIKKYLEDNNVNPVVIKYKRTRRHKFYKVMIGPVNSDEKENALKVLKKKRIKGLVIRE